MPEYKKLISQGEYANSFSDSDLVHYNWLATTYWESLLDYVNSQSQKLPWDKAWYEEYQQTPETAKEYGHEMAESEGEEI